MAEVTIGLACPTRSPFVTCGMVYGSHIPLHGSTKKKDSQFSSYQIFYFSPRSDNLSRAQTPAVAKAHAQKRNPSGLVCVEACQYPVSTRMQHWSLGKILWGCSVKDLVVSGILDAGRTKRLV